MAKKKKFGGKLDEPLPPLRVGLLMDDETKQKAMSVVKINGTALVIF